MTDDKRIDQALLVLRLFAGAIFVKAGYAKLTGLGGTEMFFGSVGVPMAGVLTPLVAIGEFFGGLGLLVGVLPRFSAGVHALIMLVATALVRWPADPGGFDGSRLELTLFATSLAIVLAGAGRYTLPVMMGKPDWDLETPLWRKMKGRD